MSFESKTSESFVPIKHAAARLGVPARWLRAEVDAGRVPCLRAGRRWLVNPAVVEAVLLARAAAESIDTHTPQRGDRQ